MKFSLDVDSLPMGRAERVEIRTSITAFRMELDKFIGVTFYGICDKQGPDYMTDGLQKKSSKEVCTSWYITRWHLNCLRCMEGFFFFPIQEVVHNL